MINIFKNTRSFVSSSKSFSTKLLVRTEIKNINGHSTGIIYLSDSSKLNALTVELGAQFKESVAQMVQAVREKKIRACVLTGDGNSFSAGGDLKWLRERHSTSSYLNSLIMVDFYNTFLCIRNISVPTIAAINGAAIGAGLCLTLACDIRIAASNAKIGFTFPKLGIHPGMGGSFLLPKLINHQQASHLLISGEIISGEKAQALGLVLESVEQENTLQRALELAAEYANGSPIAVQSLVQTIRNYKFDGLDTALQREADSQSQAYASLDFLRGLDAVKSKHVANFEGWDV